MAKIEHKTVKAYMAALPEERKEAVGKLRDTIIEHLPDGFSEQIQYNMPGYVVPHSIYPDGYHCKPENALPFMSFASQKNFVALYHMGLYADEKLMAWFVGEYPKHCKRKLDMGKSCIRFKKMEEIPYDLIGQLVQRMQVQDWVDLYEKALKK